ncbi:MULTISPECIES: imidazoleglycerol-phosphate dehydratase HisB [Kyrpidia]|uniref:Imidazoleglycerol-phosphate dehydratase [Mn(II)-dependent] n=2 Tax=Kyrpidia spormannii TaxID=2055160 RepID=A0ACA8Z5I5_9BACL|nr:MULTISPECIES: imidazoleglycerol-phosphate dehydratase HisB [Kyrpidia]MCL6576216.1 imidazoleglycerol-phosphate dehydratase HisB [Kyrpidia sp.]CAB3389863.1 imidazoleglycerol-phosphate dehydratase [Mn(II)-dependent] [Kyrpidia spormannii]CAB3390762.1 imidazoleglycerol-phosphate dehydratase [Mn(II)-dependent] [Kyrpidia spormannii]
MARRGEIHRTTGETDIRLTLDLDGEGRRSLELPVPFLKHMLDLFAKHGRFDLTVQATGDTEVDDHHTVEDIGICLGEAFARAVGDKRGIRRYGTRYAPMDETLARAVVDVSGRGMLVFRADFPMERVGIFSVELVEEFFRAFAHHAGVTLHLEVLYGRNAHHMVEGLFKAFAGALREAVLLDGPMEVPSTKGVL